MSQLTLSTFISAVLFLSGAAVCAGEADVVEVEARHLGEGRFQFDVTLLHRDEGWDHYADKWDILTPEGKLLGTRTLYHPHVNEQPFTRSLSPVNIPRGVSTVRVRAHDSRHAYGGKEAEVKITR
ncbi:MAG: hypothetical protein ABW116_03680 [Candidatus Sedimenticola sp. 20ELBAFRAG]